MPNGHKNFTYKYQILSDNTYAHKLLFMFIHNTHIPANTHVVIILDVSSLIVTPTCTCNTHIHSNTHVIHIYPHKYTHAHICIISM